MLAAMGQPEAFSGMLRIGVVETIAHTWLAALLSRFAERYPNATLARVSDTTTRLRDELLRGTLASIRPLAGLRDGIYDAVPEEGSTMTCGTLGALPNARGEAIRPAAEMEITLHDPRLNRSIVHRYAVRVLEVVA